MNRPASLTFLAFLAAGSPLSAQQYVVDRAVDGPFAVKILGVNFNEGSTLQRERILLNIASCPVQLTSTSLRFNYKDRGLRYEVQTGIRVQSPITALEIRHVLYDVFGDHMHNLSNVEARDLGAGPSTMDGTWNAYRDNDVTQHLTTVTFVASVRLADGRTWKFQMEPLIAALRTLNLEQKIEREEGRGRP